MNPKTKTHWRCRRCNQLVDMVEKRCGCKTSPSPWEPVPPPKFQILFSPDQHPYFLDVEIVESIEALKEKWISHDSDSGQEIIKDSEFDDATEAFCAYNWGTDGPNMGNLYFLNTSRRTLVHEAVHAALDFVRHKVMASAEVGEMSEDEQDMYFQEAVAVITENLYSQLEEAIYE